MYRRKRLRPGSALLLLAGAVLLVCLLSGLYRCARPTPLELKGTVSQLGANSFTLIVNPIQNFTRGGTVLVTFGSSTKIVDTGTAAGTAALRNGMYVNVRFPNGLGSSSPLEGAASQITVVR
jgi:hypothetical protein